jgi:hypothetical protein
MSKNPWRRASLVTSGLCIFLGAVFATDAFLTKQPSSPTYIALERFIHPWGNLMLVALMVVLFAVTLAAKKTTPPSRL